MMDTFPRLLLENMRLRGGNPGVRIKRLGLWKEFSWQQVGQEVKELTHAFASLGVGKGDKIAIISPNNPEMMFAITAAQTLGAVAVMINPNVTGEVLAEMLNNSDTKYVFVSDQQQVDSVLAVLPQCPKLGKLVYIFPRGLSSYDPHLIVSVEEIKKQGKTHESQNPGFFESAIAATEGGTAAFMFFSSGTNTSKPRAVPLSHDNLMCVARHVAAAENISHQDELLISTPISVPASMLYGYALSYFSGFCLSCPESGDTVFDNMREISPTIFFAQPHVYKHIVSLMYNRIEFSDDAKRKLYRRYLEREDTGIMSWLGEVLVRAPVKDLYGFGQVRLAVSSGAVFSASMHSFFNRLGIVIRQMYGLTETAACITMQTAGRDGAEHVGTQINGCEIKLGANNEIMCRGDNVFSGYYGDEEATAAVFEDGWLHTGDCGRWHDDTNELVVVDRFDAIGRLSNGQEYIPAIIETSLKSSMYLKDALVIGENKEFLAALLVAAEEITANWADRCNIRYAGYADLISNPEVIAMIAGQVREANEKCGSGLLVQPSVTRFVLLPRVFSFEENEINQTHKLCRPRIQEHLHSVIDALYRDDASIEYHDAIIVGDQRLMINSV